MRKNQPNVFVCVKNYAENIVFAEPAGAFAERQQLNYEILGRGGAAQMTRKAEIIMQRINQLRK
jgi:hypothetical protein